MKFTWLVHWIILKFNICYKTSNSFLAPSSLSHSKPRACLRLWDSSSTYSCPVYRIYYVNIILLVLSTIHAIELPPFDLNKDYVVERLHFYQKVLNLEWLWFLQIRRKHLQKKTDIEPWMTLEKALRSLDTTRQIFSSLRPGSDRFAGNAAYECYGRYGDGVTCSWFWI